MVRSNEQLSRGMIRVGLFLAWSGLIVLVMLIPLPGLELIWIGQLDALVHFSLFLILGGLVHRTAGGDLDLSGPFVVISGFLLVGPELLQHFVPTRGFSWLDLFFNLSGFVNGFLLVAFTHSLTYVNLGTLVLGGAYGSSLFKERLFEIVFAPVGEPVVLLLPALNVVLFVLLFAVLARSVAARVHLVLGGAFFFVSLRLADEPIVMVTAGGLYLLVMIVLLLDYVRLAPPDVPGVMRPLALILLVTVVLGSTVDEPFFLLNGGMVLGVGLMLGILLTVAIEAFSPQEFFSTRSSGQS